MEVPSHQADSMDINCYPLENWLYTKKGIFADNRGQHQSRRPGGESLIWLEEIPGETNPILPGTGLPPPSEAFCVVSLPLPRVLSGGHMRSGVGGELPAHKRAWYIPDLHLPHLQQIKTKQRLHSVAEV